MRLPYPNRSAYILPVATPLHGSGHRAGNIAGTAGRYTRARSRIAACLRWLANPPLPMPATFCQLRPVRLWRLFWFLMRSIGRSVRNGRLIAGRATLPRRNARIPQKIIPGTTRDIEFLYFCTEKNHLPFSGVRGATFLVPQCGSSLGARKGSPAPGRTALRLHDVHLQAGIATSPGKPVPNFPSSRSLRSFPLPRHRSGDGDAPRQSRDLRSGCRH